MINKKKIGSEEIFKHKGQQKLPIDCTLVDWLFDGVHSVAWLSIYCNVDPVDWLI